MFKFNAEYDRQELLDFVGSKQGQSGIIWGYKEPGCVIITSGGRHGKRVGYGDEKNEDGSWHYIGQGSKGDQLATAKANSLLANKNRNVLLFSTREPNAHEYRERGHGRKLYKFEGIFDVLSYEFVVGIGKREGDQLLRFHLIPADNIFDSTSSDEIPIEPENLAALWQKVQRSARGGTGITTAREYKLRSAQVKAYALMRANGICELCDQPAPFKTTTNTPFLEVHHILKLADDGPDLPENVCGICPNCHREAHYGVKRDELKAKLIQLIKEKEQSLQELPG